MNQSFSSREWVCTATAGGRRLTRFEPSSVASLLTTGVWHPVSLHPFQSRCRKWLPIGRPLVALKVLLPSGTLVDTADKTADGTVLDYTTDLHNGLLEIRDGIHLDESVCRMIRESSRSRTRTGARDRDWTCVCISGCSRKGAKPRMHNHLAVDGRVAREAEVADKFLDNPTGDSFADLFSTFSRNSWRFSGLAGANRDRRKTWRRKLC